MPVRTISFFHNVFLKYPTFLNGCYKLILHIISILVVVVSGVGLTILGPVGRAQVGYKGLGLSWVKKSGLGWKKGVSELKLFRCVVKAQFTITFLA